MPSRARGTEQLHRSGTNAAIRAGSGGDAGAAAHGIVTRDVMAGIPTDAECVTAVEETGRALASLGHEVDDAHPPALDGVFIRTREAMMTSGAAARAECLRWLEGIAGRAIEPGEISDEYFATAKAAPTEAQVAEHLRRSIARCRGYRNGGRRGTTCW